MSNPVTPRQADPDAVSVAHPDAGGAPVLILCMKWGTLYGARDVNNLARGVRRHLSRPHRFICFTDDPSGLHPGVEALPLPDLGLPPGSGDSRWQKLALFRRDLGGLIEAYSEVARRLGILGENEKVQSGGPRLVQ